MKNDHEQVEKLENEIKGSVSKIHSNLVKQIIKKFKDKSRKCFWKIKNKIFPKDKSKVPIAKQNLKGQIITNHKELENLYLDHFKFRMRGRPIKFGYDNFEKETDQSFQSILNKTWNININDWSEKDLDDVLSKLKTKQSQDTKGWANELFCQEYIGNDLK